MKFHLIKIGNVAIFNLLKIGKLNVIMFDSYRTTEENTNQMFMLIYNNNYLHLCNITFIE